MRVVTSCLLAALLLWVGDVVAWVATSNGTADPTFVGLLAGVGAAVAVGLVTGGFVLILSKAARLRGAGGWSLGELVPRDASWTGIGLALVAFAVPIIAVTRERSHLLVRPNLAAALDLAAVGIGFAVALVVVRRRRFARAGGLRIAVGVRHLPLLVAAAGFLALATNRSHLQPDGVWDLASIGVFAVLVPGLHLTLPASAAGRWSRPVAIGASVLAVTGILLLELVPSAREGTASNVRPATWVLVAGSSVDLDGDGFAPVLGGGDCDDLDADVNPDAVELPGNGRDENCRGGDRLARSPFPARPTFVPLPAPVRPPEHIVLVSIDALRADHLGVYGYGRETSPNIDAWARRSLVYQRAYTAAPYTRLALPLMLTGRTLSQIPWVRDVSPWGLPPGANTIASLLRRQGWRTGAIASHRFQNERSNWTEGFTDVDRTLVKNFHNAQKASTAHLVVERALDWQRRHVSERSFVWLHMFDPHRAYMPHDGVPSFGGEQIDLYDGEIAWCDRAFGRLIAGLRELGIEDRTAVILLSDHGEEFADHGGRYHGNTIFEEVTRIPLILQIPGAAGQTVECVTSSLDVAPTVLNLAGIDGGRVGMNGATLLADLAGCDPTRELVSELRFLAREYRALIGPRYKLVQDITNGTFQLYDLQEDPRETRTAAGRLPRVFERAKRRLLQFVEHEAGAERMRVLDEVVVSRPPTSAMRIGARFGDAIELVAADLGDRKMSADRALGLDFYWRAHRRVDPGCRVEVTFLDPRGHLLRRMTRRQVPLSGLLEFQHFPLGKIVRDTRHQGIMGTRGGRWRALVAVRCDGERIRVEGGARPIRRDRVDLGLITAEYLR